MKLSRPFFAPDAPAGGGAPPANGAPAAGDTPPPAVGAKPPEGLDPKFWDATAGQVNTAELIKGYGELAGFKKAADEAKAALPKTADDYKFEFKAPQDFKAPEGVQFKVDPKDPRIPFVREIAAKYGLPQSAVDDLVVADAKLKLADHLQNMEIVKAERAKLGETGEARMKAVETFLGEDFQHLALVMDNADAFQAMERLIKRATASNIAGGAPPNPPQPEQQSITDRWYGNKQKAS